MSEIEDAPTIEAEPVRHGKWLRGLSITEEYMRGESMFYCSCCGSRIYMTKRVKKMHKYCQNCGAKLDGKAND
jgi:transcription initiation factor IIE alpha subunit